MSLRFRRRAAVSFLLVLSLCAAAPAPTNSTSPVFTDRDALSLQLQTYQKATVTKTQDEIEQGLQEVLKAFPGTAYRFGPPRLLEYTEQTPHSGLSWIQKASSWYVSEIYPQSPGDQAGIQVGDRFLGSYSPDTIKVPTALCQTGQPVHLKLERAGKITRRSFSCKVFTRLAMPHRMLSGHVGYLRPDFSQLGRSPSVLRELVKASGDLGDQGMTSLVLDLRGSKGGSINDAASLADLFLHQGVTVRLLEREGEGQKDRSPVRAIDNIEDVDVPLVVLVNGETEGGAELLAADLQENRRARVVGQQTEGLATILEVFPIILGGGRFPAQVLFPSGVWLTPSGRNVSGLGITPDVTVIQEPLIVAFFPDQDADPQLSAAVRLLKPTP